MSGTILGMQLEIEKYKLFALAILCSLTFAPSLEAAKEEKGTDDSILDRSNLTQGAQGSFKVKNLLRGKKYKFEEQVKQERTYQKLCQDYRDALGDYSYTLPAVRDFRQELLREHYTFLLERYGEFWNYVRNKWVTIPQQNKDFIEKYRKEHKYTKWYLRGTDRIEQQETYTKLKDKYKKDFQAFAKKYFDGKPFDRFGWAYEIRNGPRGKVYPYGSVLELAEGELMISRHARIRINDRFGGFHIVVRIRNDLDGSLIKVVPHRGNFRAKKPRLEEVIRSARRWTTIYENESDMDTKEQKLGLLLDKRYDYCLAAAKVAKRKRLAENKRVKKEVKKDE